MTATNKTKKTNAISIDGVLGHLGSTSNTDK